MSLNPVWIVADTEDDSKELLESGRSGFSKQVTQIAAKASDGSQFYAGSESGNVLKFLQWCQSKSPCKVYFHNLRYDLGNLFGRALDVPDLLLVGSRIIYARWRRVIFHDSFNIWPMSVESLGKVVGLEKLPFDAESREYVFRDVEIVYRAIQLAHELALEFGIKTLPATIGSLSVKVWRKMGGESWFDDYAGSKLAYYGGRVELFRPSCNGQISYCDINSLYPWAMTQGFPTELTPQHSLDAHGIALATVEVPKDTYVTPLPVRRNDGSIIYPVGRLKGVWTTYELREAERYGAKVTKLHEVIGSKRLETYYRDFILEFYNRRLQAKEQGEKTFYKLFLNNLYGQQAMSGIISRSVNQDRSRVSTDGIPYGSKTLIETSMPLPEHVNYLHAAWVTSLARGKLLGALHRCDWRKLIYCDTDSIILEGKPPFPISDQLGAFKLEAEWSYCRTYAPKTYEGDTMVKAKGVPRRLARKFIDEGRVEYDLPFGLREAIIGYDADNAKQLSVWHRTEKVMRTKYDKKKLIDGRWFPMIQK